ncbi:hypothetical protein [Thioclava sp. GXIMD4215]|uniref:hypothetical protein n=1 Tax=Thioclava sp. GXIMD4215 TaxID=3131928 RepID=UPI0032448777
MAKHLPIAVPIKVAAQLFSMTTAEFQKLVDMGVFPPPTRSIPGHVRWSYADLLAVVDCSKLEEDEFTP